jgi:hypothetical protein
MHNRVSQKLENHSIFECNYSISNGVPSYTAILTRSTVILDSKVIKFTKLTNIYESTIKSDEIRVNVTLEYISEKNKNKKVTIQSRDTKWKFVKILKNAMIAYNIVNI